MKKYIFLLFVVIVGFTVADVQNEIITLGWTNQTGETENNTLVFFENADFPASSNELPVYTRLYCIKEPYKTYGFVIENPVYEEIEMDSSAVDKISVGEDLIVNTDVLKSGSSRKVQLQIIPLKKENRKIYRLKSFELKQFPEVLKSVSMSHDWKSESVLNSGTWLKISTSGRGIYKIPYSKLRDWGFSDPARVGVFGSGGTILSEDPGDITYDDLEQCAVWTDENEGENCLFFYAPGVVEWSRNESGTFRHRLNDYTQVGYFFLGEVESQKEAELLSSETAEATVATSTFDEYNLIENELENLLPLGSGKQWYGEKFLRGSTHSYKFSINDIDESSHLKLTVNAAGRSYQTSSMSVTSGDASFGSITFNQVTTSDNHATYASEKNKTFDVDAADGDLNVTLTYNASNSSAEAWLDYLELFYRRKLVVSDEPLFFRDSESTGEGNVVEFLIESAGSATRVFDVSDVNNLKEIPGDIEGSTLKIKQPAEELHEYVVFNSNGDFNEPEMLDEVASQNLHGLSTPEFLIISHPNFLTAAEQLAAFHRDYDNMSVEVVNAEKVYNEFSSGSKSATGIRNFIKMFYDRGNTLKYVLLLGDGSYDNKNIDSGRKNFIPTFQSENSLGPTSSFVSDDYYVMMDAGESVYNGAIDLGIGRIPAKTPYEAQLVVDKVSNYYSPEALGSWRNTVCFIGDDGNSGMHMSQSEVIADTINKNHSEFITDKIYFDAYVKESSSSGDSYPDVNKAINERVEDGVLILNYTGHANERFLADEHVLDVSDINSWTNANQLPIFVTATCEFSRYDADITSAGEYVLLNPSGGGIALFSTTRVVYSSANFALSRSFYSFIFEQDANGEHYRLGDVMRLAKTNISDNTNKRNFSLLGDPALRLSYPKYRVVTTSVNEQDASLASDTIGTLQKITVEGHITDYFGNKQSNFNGDIIPTVYDKEVEMETLGNGGQRTITYGVQENVIYKGKASVTNGEFSFSFVVPKDISYNIGKGKISYYADNGEDDAHGAYQNFYIGGSASEITDSEGPEIELYLDSKDFLSGDETSKNPTLLAYLSDENGINTVGTGIGHDITAVLDNDYSKVYVLNKYYQAEKDNFTAGSIEFPFSDLEVGTHTLTLKAWDVANNSSEVEIEFEVTGEFTINEVSNYPNPVADYTYFTITHNQSGATVDVIFDIYSPTGQRIDQFQTTVGSNGTTTNPIYWSLSESAIAATPGVYIYRAIVKNGDDIIVSKSGKMIIVR